MPPFSKIGVRIPRNSWLSLQVAPSVFMAIAALAAMPQAKQRSDGGDPKRMRKFVTLPSANMRQYGPFLVLHSPLIRERKVGMSVADRAVGRGKTTPCGTFF
jgi:hypothetical protein